MSNTGTVSTHEPSSLALLTEGYVALRWQRERMLSLLPLAVVVTNTHGQITVANSTTISRSTATHTPSSTPMKAPIRKFNRRLGDDGSTGSVASFSTETLVCVVCDSIAVWLARANMAS